MSTQFMHRYRVKLLPTSDFTGASYATRDVAMIEVRRDAKSLGRPLYLFDSESLPHRFVAVFDTTGIHGYSKGVWRFPKADCKPCSGKGRDAHWNPCESCSAIGKVLDRG